MLVKGNTLKASWFEAKTNPPASLAGVQLKFDATRKVVEGIVRHIRGDDLENPSIIRVYIDPTSEWDGPWVIPAGCTCGKPHVEINPNHIESFHEMTLCTVKK